MYTATHTCAGCHQVEPTTTSRALGQRRLLVCESCAVLADRHIADTIAADLVGDRTRADFIAELLGTAPVLTMADLIAAAQTNATARAILDERARILGLAVANVADIVDPAHVILAGAAFTDDAAGLRVAARTIADVSPVRRDIRVSRARGTITRDAARAVALDPLHSDPLSLA